MLCFCQKKADSLAGWFLLFGSENLVPGIAESRNDVALLVQSLID